MCCLFSREVPNCSVHISLFNKQHLFILTNAISRIYHMMSRLKVLKCHALKSITDFDICYEYDDSL